MKKNAKNGLITSLGAIGVIALVGGIFGFYEFNIGIVVAIGFWLLAGVVRSFLGVKKEKR
jgi:hypothetical protein